MVESKINRHQLVYLLINTSTIAQSFINLFWFNNLLHCGDSLLSPILLILINGEVLRWIANKCLLKIEAQPRDYTITYAGSGGKSSKIPSNWSVKEIFKIVFFLSLTTLLFAIVCVCLGAPPLQNHEQTLILAIQLNLLTIVPICLFLGYGSTLMYYFGDHFELQSKVEQSLLDIQQITAIGSLLGSWVCSVAYPLDWDRPWQQYPIPNIVGALVGYTVATGYCYGLILWNGGRRSFRKKNIQ